MKQTAMQEMLEWVRATLPMDLDTPRLIEEKIESMLEKEEYTMGLLLNFILKHYSIDLDARLRGYCFVNADGEEISIGEILEHYYNETFNTKQNTCSSPMHHAMEIGLVDVCTECGENL
jgi:hypothetical protein